MPIAPLMVEHRWIERVITDLGLRLSGRSGFKTIDTEYVNSVVDFLRSYADRCHHGKEEGILFRDLADKALDPALGHTMRQLIAEHEWARAATRSLVSANAGFGKGNENASVEVMRLLGELAAFYPRHLAKEEDEFFQQAVGYLTEEERHLLLSEYTAFDAALIHEKYRGIVEELAGRG